MKKTKTMKALFAPLPVIDTSIRYLVQVVEPVTMVPLGYKLTFKDIANGKQLEDLILTNWYSNLKNQHIISSLKWLKQINKVKLIECDLLVPKPTIAKKQPSK